MLLATGIIVLLSGMLCMAASVLYGFFLSIKIVYHGLGIWGVVGGFLLAPIMFGIAPFYAYFALNDSYPLLIIYGGGLGSCILIVVGTIAVLSCDSSRKPSP